MKPQAAPLTAMTLLLDVGNTRIKLGVVDTAGQWHYLASLDTHTSNPAAWLVVLTQHQTALNSVRRIVGVCVAADTVKHTLAQLLHQRLSLNITWLTGQTALQGLSNQYATPHTLGADRWLAMYGVLQTPVPSGIDPHIPRVLATLGTATTVDVLYWQKGCAHFAGGIILAGLQSAWQSVSRSTANLPDVSQIAINSAALLGVPNTTQAALLQGAICAQVGAVQVLVQQVTALYGAPLVYVAGGALAGMQGHFDQAIPLQAPVLLGLAAYAAAN